MIQIDDPTRTPDEDRTIELKLFSPTTWCYNNDTYVLNVMKVQSQRGFSKSNQRFKHVLLNSNATDTLVEFEGTYVVPKLYVKTSIMQ